MKNNYLAEIPEKHRNTLVYADRGDIRRMAFVGDGYWKAIVAKRLSKEDAPLNKMNEASSVLTSNKFLAQHFPPIGFGGGVILNEHTKGTFIEAAIYLEVEKHGFEYVSGKFCGEL